MPVSFSRLPRTLGLRTQIALNSDRSQVEPFGGFLAVRTPSNPGYYFGNFLIFDRAPRNGDDERWPAYFGDAFAEEPAVRHAAFAWSIDAEPGAIEPFLRRGYSYDESAVMTARSVHAFAPPPCMHIRPLRGDEDWAAQLALGIAAREERYEPVAYAQFKAAQVRHHRSLAERAGVWLGAFDGERLAGSCGIFPAEAGIARYQDVSVLPEYRNRGIARSLVSAAGRFALERLGAREVVIVAAAGDFPRKIYERAGLTLLEREGALWISKR